MSNLQGKCATVTAQGQITSNGNFSCQWDANNSAYVIDYNGSVTNPVPVVSLTGQNPTLSYMLNAYSSGFRLYVFMDQNGTATPTQSSFNFIVAEIA